MTRKALIRIVILVAVAAVLWYGGDFLISKFKTRSIEGMVLSISPETRTMVLSGEGREMVATALPEAEISARNGKAVDLSYIQPGFRIRGTARFDNLVALFSKVEIVEEPNIIVFEPKPDAEAKGVIRLSGIARVFEGTVNYRLRDSEGAVLAERFTTATSPNAGMYGPFKADVSYAQPKTKRGVLEVFSISADTGAEINKTILAVRFGVLE